MQCGHYAKSGAKKLAQRDNKGVKLSLLFHGRSKDKSIDPKDS